MEEFSEIERTAAEWLSCRDGGMSPAQEAELARWLAASPRHAETFCDLEHAWARLDVVRGGKKSDSPHVPERGRAVRFVRFPRAIIAAVAASIALAAVMWKIPPAAEPPFAAAVITEVGATRSLQLPDGSLVQLNTDTAVEARYDHASRNFRLIRGEAFFVVTKDTSRPFIVTVGEVAVRAVGTEFNVRLNAASIEVLVTDGMVRVDSDSGGSVLPNGTHGREPAVLAAGERAVVPLAAAGGVPAAVNPVSAVEIRQALAWQEQRLDFDNMPLMTIVAEFNRYNQHRLVIADPRLESLTFGGTYPANDYGSFVRLLVSNFGVVAEAQGNQTILKLAP